MKTKEFDSVVNRAVQRSLDVLVHKAKEYARGEDRLHNFNRGAQVAGESRERVLKGFMLKHLISVFDIIDDIDAGKIPSREYVDEKIGDSINYLLLLEASLVDRIEKSNNESK